MAGIGDDMRLDDLAAKAGIRPSDAQNAAIWIDRTVQGLKSAMDFTEGTAVPEFWGMALGSVQEDFQTYKTIMAKYNTPEGRAVLDEAYRQITDGNELSTVLQDLQKKSEHSRLMQTYKKQIGQDAPLFGARSKTPADDNTEKVISDNLYIAANGMADGAQPFLELKKKIDDLKALYETADAMRLDTTTPAQDQIYAYQDFLQTYKSILDDKDFVKTYGMGNKDALKKAIDEQIGIPQDVFSDKGAHYMELLADQIEAYGDQGEDKMALAIYSQSQLYNDIFPIDQTHLERLSGYSRAYLQETQFDPYSQQVNNGPPPAETEKPDVKHDPSYADSMVSENAPGGVAPERPSGSDNMTPEEKYHAASAKLGGARSAADKLEGGSGIIGNTFFPPETGPPRP